MHVWYAALTLVLQLGPCRADVMAHYPTQVKVDVVRLQKNQPPVYGTAEDSANPVVRALVASCNVPGAGPAL